MWSRVRRIASDLVLVRTLAPELFAAIVALWKTGLLVAGPAFALLLGWSAYLLTRSGEPVTLSATFKTATIWAIGYTPPLAAVLVVCAASASLGVSGAGLWLAAAIALLLVIERSWDAFGIVDVQLSRYPWARTDSGRPHHTL